MNGYSNHIYDFYQPFKIDIGEYMTKFHAVLDFLETHHISYSFLNIDRFRANIDFSTFSTLLRLTCSRHTFEKIKEKIVNFHPVDKKKMS